MALELDPSRLPVLLVEDDPLVGRGQLRQFGRAGLVTEWVKTLDEARARLTDPVSPPPGAVILDLDLPDGRGEDLLPLLASRHPDCPVLVVSGHVFGRRAAELVRRRVFALSKPVDPAVVVDLILHPSEAPSSRDTGGTPADRKSAVRPAERAPVLTPQERRILAHLMLGEDNKAIADALGLAVKTIEYHISHLLKKTGEPSTKRLIAAFTRVAGGRSEGPVTTLATPPAPAPVSTRHRSSASRVSARRQRAR